MISKYSHKGLMWIDLESPSDEELSHIVDLHSIPSYIHENIKANTNENKIETKDDFLFMILNVPKVLGKEIIDNKIIFATNDNLVLTVHDNPIKAFNNFGKEMELDILVEANSKIKNNSLLFAHLLKNLYLHSETQLVESDSRVNFFKKQITKNKKKIKLYTILATILLITTIIFICL
jgi:Mg2+ and Co2+ transporter CorA